MTIHPLRLAYVDYIKEHYGFQLWQSTKPERTEIVAQKVSRLGLGYAEFIDVAVTLWDVWAEKKGWPYPYWTLVTSDKTFERIGELSELTSFVADDDRFELELLYAGNYISWVLGKVERKPRRYIAVDVNTRARVAEYICTVYGVEFTSPNYNHIASQMRGQLER